jgi:hypothetical protein
LFFASCSKEKDLFQGSNVSDEQINENVQNVFGVKFAENQDWSTMVKSSVSITADASLSDIAKVQILTLSPFGSGDGNGATILNEAEVTKGQTIELTYDAPLSQKTFYAACVSKDGQYFIKNFALGDSKVSFNSSAKKAPRRAMAEGVMDKVNALPTPVIKSIIDSYAKERNWEGFENNLLYEMGSRADYQAYMMSFDEYAYSEEAAAELKDIILTYLPNKVSNIEKIRGSAYYNAGSYPITTGDDPIILEPIYKDDGGWKEVENCDLFYYYFQDKDIQGMTDEQQVQFFKNLPMYKALDLMNSVATNAISTGMADKQLKKNTAYALIYWGEGIPTIGTEGSYQFPKGYRIGFMLRNHDNATRKSGNQTIYTHHGELYCDGRLNKEVNSYEHLASAKLGPTEPRMAWLSANNKLFLCCESGTDRDFNDVVFEIEGGVEPMHVTPIVEEQIYTYCFEDTQLGDYDLNDVVIKTKRLSQTSIEYSIVACGAHDEIYVKNINQGAITDNAEVHSLFKVDQNTFVNTVAGDTYYKPITVKKTVSKTFSFTDPETQPYLYNKTKDLEVRIAKKGEDPHGIMIPNDFQYPKELICIKLAYTEFNNWGQNPITSTDWYKTPEEEKVYK